MTNFTQHNGHPPTLVRVWRSLHADGRAPLVSQWIAIPHENHLAPNVCAFYLCSLELRSSAPRESAAAPVFDDFEFDDPGPVLTLTLSVIRA